MDTSAQSPVSESTSAQEPVNTPPDKLPFSRTRLILFGLLGIVLLIIVGGGAYVLSISSVKQLPMAVKTPQVSPTIDPTAMWKVYKNNLYEFKYPQNWYIQGTSTEQFFYTSQEDAAAAVAPSSKFSVTTADKNLYKSMFADPIGIKKEIGDKIFETKISTVSVGSHPAFKVKTEVQAGSQTDALPGFSVVIDMGFDVLNLNITGSSDADNKLLDQILSTFKFTDSSASTDTSNWKSYTSLKGKFQIQYLPDNRITINNTPNEGVYSSNASIEIDSPVTPDFNKKYAISIYFERDTTNLSVKEKVSELNGNICEPMETRKDAYQSITIDNKEALLAKDICGGRFGGSSIFTKNNGLFYIILIETFRSYNDVEPSFKNILSTFKFTQ